jgi:hypothetical protein
MEPLRYLYDLHHFSRFVGSSIAMINGHYGLRHLARDGREHAVSLLDALAIQRAVDAGWTPARAGAGRRLLQVGYCRSRAHVRRSRGFTAKIERSLRPPQQIRAHHNALQSYRLACEDGEASSG